MIVQVGLVNMEQSASMVCKTTLANASPVSLAETVRLISTSAMKIPVNMANVLI